MELITATLEHATDMAVASEGQGATVDLQVFNPSAPLVIDCTTSTVDGFNVNTVTASVDQFLALCAREEVR